MSTCIFLMALLATPSLVSTSAHLIEIPNLYVYKDIPTPQEESGIELPKDRVNPHFVPYQFDVEDIHAEKFAHPVGDDVRYQYKLTFVPKERTVLIKKNSQNPDLTIIQRPDQLVLLKKHQEVELGMTGDFDDDADEDDILAIADHELSREVPRHDFGRIRVHQYAEPQYSLEDMIQATYNNKRVLAIMRDEYPDAFNFSLDKLGEMFPDFDTVRAQYSQKVRGIIKNELNNVYLEVLQDIMRELPEDAKKAYNSQPFIGFNSPLDHIKDAITDSIKHEVDWMKYDTYLALPVMDYYNNHFKKVMKNVNIGDTIRRKLREKNRNFMLDAALKAIQLSTKQNHNIYIQAFKLYKSHMGIDGSLYLPSVMVKSIVQMISEIIAHEINKSLDDENMMKNLDYHSEEDQKTDALQEESAEKSKKTGESQTDQDDSEHQSGSEQDHKSNGVDDDESLGSEHTPDNLRSYEEKAVSAHPVDKLDTNLYHLIDIVHKPVAKKIKEMEEKTKFPFGPFTDAHLDKIKDFFVKTANFDNYMLGLLLGGNRDILDDFLLKYEQITSQRTFTYELFFTPLGAEVTDNDNRGNYLDNKHFILKCPLIGEITKYSAPQQTLQIFERGGDEASRQSDEEVAEEQSVNQLSTNGSEKAVLLEDDEQIVRDQVSDERESMAQKSQKTEPSGLQKSQGSRQSGRQSQESNSQIQKFEPKVDFVRLN